MQMLVVALSVILYSTFGSAKLDMQEGDILKKLSEKFGITEWSLDKDPCNTKREYLNINCHCPRNTTCHITNIMIKRQNISGGLPLEFTKLQHLQFLDLSRNYLSGTIPSEWATMRLSNLTLMGNRLSGRFPTTLVRMNTLIDLNIEGNHFYGPLPSEIVNLKSLCKLVVSSNDFTGKLPITLANLTNLTDVRISDNNFTGKIPNFIGQWTNIEKLFIQGCSLEGPFPPSISALTNLIELRVSDLKGEASKFPQLEKMTTLKILILRNCLLYGTIPEYIGNMKLEALDLSFNNFSGLIPQSLSQLRKAKFIYLTKNNLSGTIPGWVLTNTKDVDLSYNHFTWDASHPQICSQGFTNLVESCSSTIDAAGNNNISPCLRKDFPCYKSKAQQIYSLHINCGGKEVIINNTIKYERDDQSSFMHYYNGGGWAFSSTGNFFDHKNESLYVLSNTSNLHNMAPFDIPLYTKARTAAISLTYYGLCLLNGNYNVKLHFAEIVFTEDNSYCSLGKRVFDVYVQGELKIKDFDIVKEAGGTGRAVIKRYTIDVKSNTLKIQLYWAGKGTTGIPSRGSTYGPIISAISVDPNFKPPKFGKKTEVGLIVGTVGGGVFFVVLVMFILWRKGYIMGGETAYPELIALDLENTTSFSYNQIKAATKNFNPINKLGEGGYGSVYKGILADGTIIAVKQLSPLSKQGAREFVNEIGLISALRHPNLVRLYGCSAEGSQPLLIYEYMENNSLSHALLGDDKLLKVKFTWPVRLNIILGIARGLVYLHEESYIKIIHRDIKASNVLLDKAYFPKISDFGLAKLNDEQKTQMITQIAGTRGYMAPEYLGRGCLTPKADVYSFGILALEIVSGISIYTTFEEETYSNVFDMVFVFEGMDLLRLVDPDLGSEYSPEEALKVLNVAKLCVHAYNVYRPTMSETIGMLEGRIDIQYFREQRCLSKIKALDSFVRRRRNTTKTLPASGEPCTESFVTESIITE